MEFKKNDTKKLCLGGWVGWLAGSAIGSVHGIIGSHLDPEITCSQEHQSIPRAQGIEP